MKVEDVLTKIRMIDTLMVDVARGALTTKSSEQLCNVLEEYKKLLEKMELSSSQRLVPSIWEDDYGSF